MAGHSHLYQRGYKQDEKITYNTFIAIWGFFPYLFRYMIVGGGGGELEKKKDRVADYKFYDKTYFGYHYLLMEIGSSSIKFLAYDIDNSLFDNFEILF